MRKFKESLRKRKQQFEEELGHHVEEEEKLEEDLHVSTLKVKKLEDQLRELRHQVGDYEQHAEFTKYEELLEEELDMAKKIQHDVSHELTIERQYQNALEQELAMCQEELRDRQDELKVEREHAAALENELMLAQGHVTKHITRTEEKHSELELVKQMLFEKEQELDLARNQTVTLKLIMT